MNAATVAHRWANKDFGRNNTLTASRSCHSEGRNYFSYSTVFGQWLDLEKNVVAIFDGSTSSTSSKYKLHKGLFPDDVHVFPLDFCGGHYGLRNCNLVSSYNFKDEDFKEYHRMQMLDHYVERIYNQLAAIKNSNKKGLENVDFSAWGYVDELCGLYKDTSIAKYLKWTKNRILDDNISRKRKLKLVRMLKDGERNVQVLTDALFGEGTFKKYWDYCARYRKSADKRTKVEVLCNRLGIRSPYEKWGGYNVLDHEMSADDIRKLTAKERVELHFKALAHKEYKKHEDERKKLYNKRKDNAYRWIVGFEPVIESEYSHSYKDCQKVRNKQTGEVYGVGGNHIYGFYWLNTSVSFDYDSFRKSEDKEQWIADFYAKCNEVALNRKALALLKKYGVTAGKEHSWDDDKYIAYRGEDMTENERILCERFIAKQNKHFVDEEARRRAAEIERLRREEEKRKEREYMEKVKQEQIDECIKDGLEGCRNLWRKHLTSINESEERYDEVAFNSDGDFFYEGNVLLRLNLNKDKVETSKNIRIPVDTCKKMWRIVSKWHENPSCFKPVEIDTKGSGRYTISSYQNDILTAGCHKIAYTEMERMYNEIVELENNAA